MTDIQKTREQLAAIEHQRWASWQEWLHTQMKHTPVGLLMSPEYYQHLEEQIHADYSELSDKEKASDLEQVDRYWPIIVALLEQARSEALTALLEAMPEKKPSNRGHMDNMLDDGFNQALSQFTAIIERQRTSKENLQDVDK